MKSRVSILHRVGISLLTVALAGCGAFSSASVVDPRTRPDSGPSAVQTSSVILTGQLVLFGAEIDAWLGVRDASGRVTRLVFKSKEELAERRQMQNQKVIVTGLPLPAYLGRPQLQVTAIQVQP